MPTPSRRRRSALARLCLVATVGSLAWSAAAATPAGAATAPALRSVTAAVPARVGPAASTAVVAGSSRSELVRLSGTASTPLRLGTSPRASLVPERDRTAPGSAAPGSTSPGSTAPGGGSGLVLSATPLSNWEVTFMGFSSDAQIAFQRAVDVWARTIPSAVTIRVHATMANLGDPYLLGYTGPSAFYVSSGDPSGTAYPVAALEAARGSAVNGDGESDVEATFNTSPATPWFYGAGAPGTSRTDFSSVVLHELAHGLGITGYLDKTGSVGTYNDHPGIFDRFVASARPSNQSVLAYPDRSTALGSALTSGTLTWSGPLGTASAGGGQPPLYSPGTWQPGSSVYHLDERSYPQGNANSLMTPILNAGEVIRDPGDIVLGMLTDMGYPPVQVRRYVDALYRDFLARPADSAGLNGWTDALVSGRFTRYQLALSLATTDEYLGAVVSRLYRDVLGREPDQAGLDGWRQAIRAGMPIATVGAGFYASDENYALTGGTAGDPGPWVEGLYRALLGRASDPGGKAQWVQVSRTQGRLAVTTAFYGSLETLQRRVQLLYGTLLGRPADPVGLQGWPAVVSERGDLALAASLASSAEYYDRAQTR